MSGALNQQFPQRSSSIQDPVTGAISSVWYHTFQSLWIRTGGGTAQATTTALQQQITALGAQKLNRNGDTMTGRLTLSGPPVDALNAATKSYVDTTGGSSKVSKSGDTMSGLLTLSGNPVAVLGAVPKQYADAGDATNATAAAAAQTTANAAVAKSGGTMTGALVLSGAPTAALQATTKTYVDTADSTNATAAASAQTTANAALPATGGTMTGALIFGSGIPLQWAGTHRSGYDSVNLWLSYSVAGTDVFHVTDAGAGVFAGTVTATGYRNGITQVVGPRVTGWGVAAGGSKSAFIASTATLAQTSAAVAQLIADLTTHGLIGT